MSSRGSQNEWIGIHQRSRAALTCEVSEFLRIFPKICNTVYAFIDVG
jgi:hypothetical protein